jgi:glycosyltransferase involved in cell wall biosynthesis
VLIAAPQPFYEDRGTPIAVRQLAEALGQLEWRVEILTYPVGQHVTIPRTIIRRAANPFGIDRVAVGFSMQKLLLDASLVPALWKRMQEGGIDCVHAVEEAAFPAVWLGRRRGIPVVYDMQSSIPEQLLRHRYLGSEPAQRMLRMSERWLLRRASFVVTSAGLADHVRAAAPHTRVSEWRYGSPLPLASDAQAAALRRSLSIAESAPVILYSGTFETYQGLDLLIGAIPHVRESIPDAVFVLVGAEKQHADFYSQECASVAPRGSYMILERVPRREMPRFFAMADVLVSPRSYGGNLPLKIFDYMNAGRPIVATDLPTHRVLLDEQRALLVSPDSSSLAEAVIELLTDRARGERLSANARAHAARHFGWRGFVRSVDALYRDVVAAAS